MLVKYGNNPRATVLEKNRGVHQQLAVPFIDLLTVGAN